MSTTGFTITRRNGQTLTVLVDEADMEHVRSAGPWHVTPDKKTFYVRHSVRTGHTNKKIPLHVLLIGPGVDHINGDGLDNRRCNLRLTSSGENSQNRQRRSDNASGYPGVNWHKASKRWRAQIGLYGRKFVLGYFKDAAEAYRAYLTAKSSIHPFSNIERLPSL